MTIDRPGPQFGPVGQRRHFAAALDLSAHCMNPPPSPVTSSVNVVCACRHCTYVSTAGGARALSSCSQQVLTKFNTLPKQTDSEPRRSIPPRTSLLAVGRSPMGGRVGVARDARNASAAGCAARWATRASTASGLSTWLTRRPCRLS